MPYSKYLAFFMYEFLCTALLVAGTCLEYSYLSNSLLSMSIAYGLTNFVLTSFFSNLSGGYANPAVVLALWWRGCMPIKRLIVYVAGEMSGAVAGHYAVHKILAKPVTDAMCVFGPIGGMTDRNIMANEFVLTFLLIMTWCVLWDYRVEIPMACYLAAANTLVYFLGASLSGGCTNPARTLAPFFFQKSNHAAKLCIAGQMMGGLAAPILWGCLDFWAKL